MDLNLQLKPGSKPVDGRIAIPEFNDGFISKAPDLRAHQTAATPLRDGPRWLTWQPSYR
jgi:hypothetical protein